MVQEPAIVSDKEDQWFDKDNNEDDNEHGDTPLTAEFGLNGLKNTKVDDKEEEHITQNVSAEFL